MGADLYIGKISSVGFGSNSPYYFRDSYNDSNLLWKFNLSYWADLNDLNLLNKDGNMSPTNAKKFLHLLKVREESFFENIKKLPKVASNATSEWEFDQRYYTDKYEDLKKFLKLAIKEKKHIEFSV